jgi:hypothetical protein
MASMAEKGWVNWSKSKNDEEHSLNLNVVCSAGQQVILVNLIENHNNNHQYEIIFHIIWRARMLLE